MRNSLLAAFTVAILASPVFAGDTSYKSSNESFAPVYGTGFYGALQFGANVYQDYGGGASDSIGGLDVSIDVDDNVGIFGGLKFGYVFGSGFLRPAIELDAFYNGFESDINIDIENIGNFDGDADVHTGAGLVNFLLRFDFGRFQPYVGMGAGIHYSELSDFDINFRGQRVSTNAGGDSTGFAWQAVAGADFYFTEKVSGFIEYKFLNYEDSDLGPSDDAVRQQLVGAGIRFHF